MFNSHSEPPVSNFNPENLEMYDSSIDVTEKISFAR
jgi:hypothetical protein